MKKERLKYGLGEYLFYCLPGFASATPGYYANYEGAAMDEFDFFAKNELSEFMGKWVAILDNKVVASGPNFREVAEAVDRKFKGRKALIARVPERLAQIL